MASAYDSMLIWAMCRSWRSSAFLSSYWLQKCCLSMLHRCKHTCKSYRSSALGTELRGFLHVGGKGMALQSGAGMLWPQATSVLYCMYRFLLVWTINLSSGCFCHLHVSPFPGALLSWLLLQLLSCGMCVCVRILSQINGLPMTSCKVFISYYTYGCFICGFSIHRHRFPPDHSVCILFWWRNQRWGYIWVGVVAVIS